MIKLGLVGLGGICRTHMTALESVRQCLVTAGADPDKKAREAFLSRYPEAQVFHDHRRLLKETDVDAVLLCTPTLTHKEIAIDAMKKGRHVLSEKPMARTVADCKRMIDVANKTGRVLVVAHCRRFDKNWGRLAKIITSGQIGRPVLWRSVMAGTGPGRWFMDDRLGGGPLLDGAVHNYDFANYMFGEPESVLAREIKLTHQSAVDTASAIVQYKSGDQLLMSWAWGPRGDSAHDVLGPKGTILFGAGDMQPKGEEGYTCYRLWLNGKDMRLIKFKYQGIDMYIQEDQHFVDCILGKVKNLASGEESMKGVAVAEAILKAARGRGNRKVIW